MKLKDKSAIVTAAAGGIGRAIAFVAKTGKSRPAGRRRRGAVFRLVPVETLTGQSLVVSHGWFMQ
jgi:hypothetical protein